MSAEDGAAGAPPVLLPLSLVGLHSVSYSSDDGATTVPAAAAATAAAPSDAGSDSDPEHTQLQMEPPLESPMPRTHAPARRGVRPVPFELPDDDAAEGGSEDPSRSRLLPLP